jgi:hypothetical protein
MVCNMLHPNKYVKPSEVFLFGMSYLCEGSLSAISFPLDKHCWVYFINLKWCMVLKRFLFQWWHWKKFGNHCYYWHGISHIYDISSFSSLLYLSLFSLSPPPHPSLAQWCILRVTQIQQTLLPIFWLLWLACTRASVDLYM